MTNRFYLTALLLFLVYSTNVYGQNIRISGRIVDSMEQPLPNCTVMLFNAQDSILANGLISDTNGEFIIQTNSRGSYFLEVSMLGFDKSVSLLEIGNTPILLKDILLKESSVNLSEITVIAPKEDIRFSPGKTTVNLSSPLIKSRSNILEVLKTMPGVFIREDGTIALNGQTGSQIFINGKSTYLSGETLINLLRSMPAASVDKIELITHPSAQYDAAGNSGIINLYTDKHFFKGLTLSTHARYSQGKYAKGDIGFNFAYRSGKICLFSDYSYYTGKDYNELSIKREDLHMITQEPLDRWMFQNADRKWRYNSHYYRIGLDYDISSKIYLGAYTTGFIMDRKQSGEINSQVVEYMNFLSSELYTQNKNNKNPGSYSGGVSMTYKANENIEWNNYFDLVYHNQPENISQYDKFYNHVSEQNTQDTLKGKMDGKIHIYAAESNITFLIGKNSKIRTGGKTSFISVDNSAVYHNKLYNEWIENSSLNKQFSYDENINAAYLQLETQFANKFSIQVGVRVENTNIKGTVSQLVSETDSSYSSHYTHLFPSLNFEYKFQNENALSFLYSRRINRPNYNAMNPFVYIFDNYLYEQGNPNLKPSLSDNLELSFVWKNKLKTSIFLLRVSDPISKSFHLAEDDRILVYPDNLSSSYIYGLRINSTIFKPASWWRLNANLALNYKKYKWAFINEQEKASVFSPVIGLNNQFEFANDWSAEIYASYNGKTADGQYAFKPMFIANAGVRKQILKGNGTISLVIDDILQSNLLKGEIKMPGRSYNSRERETGRLFHISFSYRFKQGKDAKESNRKRGIEESGRI